MIEPTKITNYEMDINRLTHKQLDKWTMFCEWEDDRHGCCAVFRHESPSSEKLSRDDIESIAENQGWLIINGKTICPICQAEQSDEHE